MRSSSGWAALIHWLPKREAALYYWYRFSNMKLYRVVWRST